MLVLLQTVQGRSLDFEVDIQYRAKNSFFHRSILVAAIGWIIGIFGINQSNCVFQKKSLNKSTLFII